MKIFVQAILFDLDGVLVDSRAVIRRHWQRWATANDFDIEQVLSVAHGRRPADTMRLLMPDADNAEQLAMQIVDGEATDDEGLVRLPGVVELISSLPTGRWTVATSGPRPIAEFRLRYAGVPIIETMVTAEAVENGKPAPDPYVLAAQRLGFEAEQCLVIEDAPPGVRAGRAAGARVIALTTTHPRNELEEAGASFMARDLASIQVTFDPARAQLAVEVVEEKAPGNG